MRATRRAAAVTERAVIDLIVQAKIAPNTSRVAILEVRNFRTNRLHGNCDNPMTGTHDKGAPLLEWKRGVDEMGREDPVCTATNCGVRCCFRHPCTCYTRCNLFFVSLRKKEMQMALDLLWLHVSVAIRDQRKEKAKK